jgi:type I restriction enzyme S subunit
MAKYLYYVLKNMETTLNGMKRGAGVPHVSGEALSQIMLPVPAIQEQNRIVELLDQFDKLSSNMADGLPAEIEARKKQYEYYRDKLLALEPLTE